MSFKKCYKCGIEKDESEFYKDKRNKDGLCFQCKECQSQYDKARNARPEIKERKKERARERYARPEVKEKKKEYDAEYYARPEVKERIKEYDAKPENKERRNQKRRERCQIDSCYKLRICISNAVGKGLKKNCGSKHGSSILSKLPYTMQ